MNVYIHILILQNLGYGQLTVKSGIWDIGGGVKNLGYGILGFKNLGYGILGGKKSGIWDMGTPVSPPPPWNCRLLRGPWTAQMGTLLYWKLLMWTYIHFAYVNEYMYVMYVHIYTRICSMHPCLHILQYTYAYMNIHTIKIQSLYLNTYYYFVHCMRLVYACMYIWQPQVATIIFCLSSELPYQCGHNSILYKLN